jgi:hypothetical protein
MLVVECSVQKRQKQCADIFFSGKEVWYGMV